LAAEKIIAATKAGRSDKKDFMRKNCPQSVIDAIENKNLAARARRPCHYLLIDRAEWEFTLSHHV
jgi:hypothetical protein